MLIFRKLLYTYYMDFPTGYFQTLTIFAKKLHHKSLTHTLRIKSVRIRSYSGPYSVRMRKNTDQNNSEYGHFLRSDGPK